MTTQSAELLADMLLRLSAIPEWKTAPIHDEIESCSVDNEVGMGKVAQPIRVAVTGTTISPPLDATLELLGRERTLGAITQAIDWIASNEPE